MKKLIASILAVTLTFGAVALPMTERGITFGGSNVITASAEEDLDYGDWTYQKDDVTKSAKIIRYNGSAAVLNVPSTIKGYKVIELGDKAFCGNDDIVNVTIPNGVKSLGYYTFWSCSNLKSVIFPDSVQEIGFESFESCYNLVSVKLPNGLSTIESEMFLNCKNLKNITIPSSVTSIKMEAFKGCEKLDNINIPKKATNISDHAFAGCKSLKSIVFPKGTTSISWSVCNGCSSLVNVTIPEGVKNISQGAFSNCTNLKTVTIPKSVNYIYDTDFTSFKVDCSFGYYNQFSSYNKVPGFKIKCYAGTAGEKYAKENGFAYELLDKPISKAKVTGLTTKTYTGKQIKPTIKVTYGKTVLKNGTDYTVKYGTNKIGKGTVTITGKGKYSGKITKTFTINPRKTPVTVKSTAKGKFTATVAKKTEATKYQIQYCSNSKFKGAKKVTTKATKAVIKGTSKKTYYVRVRTIKTIGKTNYVSGWSAVKKVKVK